MMTRLFLVTMALVACTSDAFVVCPTTSTTTSTSTSLWADGTGGWGPNARKITKEEYVRGERNAFEGYNLRERGEFMRQVKQDGEDLKNSEMAELLGVASIAGINVKDPGSRLNKFDLDIDGGFAPDDDDLDVSVQWEAKDPFGN
jgi:hypothetical protein